MNDDPERLLERLAPQGAPAELRGKVLGAVAARLAADSASRWERRAGLAVAASVLVGVCLNVWAVKTSNERLARLYGPTPLPREVTEIVETVESVTDAETGRWVQQRFEAAWPPRFAQPPRSICSYQGTLNDLELAWKDREDAKAQEDSQMDRDRRREPDRDMSDCDRDPCLEVCRTA